MNDMIVGIGEIEYHRNGVTGEGFHTVRFESLEGDGTMVGVVFETPGHVAVFEVHSLWRKPTKKFRGDLFEPELRAAIAKMFPPDEEPALTRARVVQLPG